MAAGKVHSIGGLIAIAGVIYFSLQYKRTIDPEIEMWYIIGGAIFAHLVDPDMLDQHQVTTHGENRIRYLFTSVGFYLMQWYLYPIAKILPHRSMFSHLPPINTIIRLLYFTLPLYIIFYFANYNIEIDSIAIYYIILGGIPVDAMHLLLDKIPIFKERKQ